VDRKMLAELAVQDPQAFATLVDIARSALPKTQSGAAA